MPFGIEQVPILPMYKKPADNSGDVFERVIKQNEFRKQLQTKEEFDIRDDERRVKNRMAEDAAHMQMKAQLDAQEKAASDQEDAGFSQTLGQLATMNTPTIEKLRLPDKNAQFAPKEPGTPYLNNYAGTKTQKKEPSKPGILYQEDVLANPKAQKFLALSKNASKYQDFVKMLPKRSAALDAQNNGWQKAATNHPDNIPTILQIYGDKIPDEKKAELPDAYQSWKDDKAAAVASKLDMKDIAVHPEAYGEDALAALVQQGYPPEAINRIRAARNGALALRESKDKGKLGEFMVKQIDVGIKEYQHQLDRAKKTQDVAQKEMERIEGMNGKEILWRDYARVSLPYKQKLEEAKQDVADLEGYISSEQERRDGVIDAMGGKKEDSKGPTKVSTPEEANKLAPGTHYITPDGQEFTR